MTKETPKPKEELEQKTPPKTGPEKVLVELTPEEQAELNDYREITKKTGFKKFSESANEAVRLAHENEAIARERDELKEKLEKSESFSEDDLRRMNPDYDLMDESSRKLFRESVEAKHRLAVYEAKEKMQKDYNALPLELRKKIESKGSYEQFKNFACAPDNAGQKSLLNIAKAYLFDADEDDDDEEDNTPPIDAKPLPGLEDGGAGDPPPPPVKEGEMTAAQVADLRTKNPKEYARLTREHKIKIIPG